MVLIGMFPVSTINCRESAMVPDSERRIFAKLLVFRNNYFHYKLVYSVKVPLPPRTRHIQTIEDHQFRVAWVVCCDKPMGENFVKPSTSAFLTRMNGLAPLSSTDREVLARFEQSAERRSKREAVFDADRPDQRIAIVRSGWAVTRITSDPSQTTIANIFMAGDLIGLSDMGFPNLPHETTMQTDGTVSLFSRSALMKLAAEHPQIFGRIVAMASLNQVAMMDRLHAVTRYSAEDRLMHFLLTIKMKTAQGSDQPSDRFLLPMSQKEIGDVLGLTDIYINRLLSGLQKRGEITLARPYVRISNVRRWEERLKFQNRFDQIALDWTG